MSKYSIILPVHNGGAYIRDCVNSILAQTYTDFDLIILENCSTDGTAQYVKELTDKRVKVYPSIKFLPMERNWQRILAVPKSEFMTMIGADDILFPNYLQVMDDLIGQHPFASVYHSHYNYINSAGTVLWDCKPAHETETALDFLEAICFNRASIMGTGFMVRSYYYDLVGGIPDYPNLMFADIELLIELIRISYKATSPEKLFSFRLHPAQISASSNYTNYADGFHRFVQYLRTVRNEDSSIALFLQLNSLQFMNHYCKGAVHRLIKTPIANRGGTSVKQVLGMYKKYATGLAPMKTYKPTAKASVMAAKIIDSNYITRALYLLFKQVYKKPIYR
jgi:glycosyltransferase involved in cell wall biosynthesis